MRRLILGLPIVDTLLSMMRRFVKSLRLFQSDQASLRERLLGVRSMFQPDQRHIHHRLLALGFSHRNAVLLYAFAVGLSLLALMSVLAQYRNAGVVMLAVGLATYIGIRKLGYDPVQTLYCCAEETPCVPRGLYEVLPYVPPVGCRCTSNTRPQSRWQVGSSTTTGAAAYAR